MIDRLIDIDPDILDTGIRISHSEFGGRTLPGWDFVDDDAVAADCHSHGTHVAGTVAGATYGVAKGATVVPVRVLDCNGSGTAANLSAGWGTRRPGAGYWL